MPPLRPFRTVLLIIAIGRCSGDTGSAVIALVLVGRSRAYRDRRLIVRHFTALLGQTAYLATVSRYRW